MREGGCAQAGADDVLVAAYSSDRRAPSMANGDTASGPRPRPVPTRQGRGPSRGQDRPILSHCCHAMHEDPSRKRPPGAQPVMRSTWGSPPLLRERDHRHRCRPPHRRRQGREDEPLQQLLLQGQMGSPPPTCTALTRSGSSCSIGASSSLSSQPSFLSSSPTSSPPLPGGLASSSSPRASSCSRPLMPDLRYVGRPSACGHPEPGLTRPPDKGLPR